MDKQENESLNFLEESKKNNSQPISLPEKLFQSKPGSLLKVGTVISVHGIKGEVFVRPFNEEFEWPKDITQIFLNGRPFSVKYFRKDYFDTNMQGFL